MPDDSRNIEFPRPPAARRLACPETELVGDWLLNLVADEELETHLRTCAACREAAEEHAWRYLGAQLIDEAHYDEKRTALAGEPAQGKVIRFPALPRLAEAASWVAALLPLGYTLVSAGVRSHSTRGMKPRSSEAALREQFARDGFAKLAGEGIELEFSTPRRGGLAIYAASRTAGAPKPRLTLTARRAGEAVFSLNSKKPGELQLTDADLARMQEAGADEITLTLDAP